MWLLDIKAKSTLMAQDLVKTLLDNCLFLQQETLFGDFLEGLAIYVSGLAYDGKKSSAEGVDLEFDKEGVRYIVTIKSGPNWANSGQIKRMIDNFRQEKRILRSSSSSLNVVAVNGCCYGRDTRPDKGDYLKYCGQSFWELISGSSDLYVGIIKPLGHRAKERNEEFLEEYSQIINKFTLEFSQEFCADGKIDWQALVKFNSSAHSGAQK